MEPDVPPDFGGVFDAIGADEQIDVVVKFREAGEGFGHASMRESFEDDLAIRLQTGVLTLPKRRVRRERKKVGQKIAHLVHDRDADLAIRDTHVNVETENDVAASDLLHVLQDRAVALLVGNGLVFPPGKRMGTSRGDLQSVAGRQPHQLRTQVDDLPPRRVNVRANLCFQLDHRLM